MTGKYISTLTEAAERAGVSRVTMAKWVKNYPSLNESAGKGYSIPVDLLDQIISVRDMINGKKKKHGGDDGK